MKYMVARFIRENEELAYRVYTTDTLRLIAQGTRSYPQKRYAELIEHAPRDTRSGDEIASDVILKCGLKVIQ